MVDDSEERGKGLTTEALVRVLVSLMGLHIPTSISLTFPPISVKVGREVREGRT